MLAEAPPDSLPRPGRYRHFKGSEYELLSIARHSETEELLAVYRQVEDPSRIWVRPLEMFTDTVELPGEVRRRFEPTGDRSPGRLSRLSGILTRIIRLTSPHGSGRTTFGPHA